VLAIVQVQQQALGAERRQERRQQGPARLLAHAERRRHGLGHQHRVRQRRQLHQPDAILETLDLVGGDAERQARLAGPARPD
jgi:hypothetical protein